MTLVDALAALQEGAVPTNEQSLAFLRNLESLLPAQDDLSKPGSKLVDNNERLLQTAQRLIRERNTNEELQEFFWRTKGSIKAATKHAKSVKLTFGAGAKESASSKENDDQSKDVKNFKQRLTDTGGILKSDTIQAAKHVQTLVRLALIQPELRHVVADLGYVFAEAVDRTAKQSVDQAQLHLGQAKSATGTFQNVAQRALQQARAEQNRAKEAEDQQKTLLRSPPPSLAALREQVSAAFDKQSTSNVNIETIRQELKSGQVVAIVEEIKRRALECAAILAKGDEEKMQEMRTQIESGKLPPDVLKALRPSADKSAEIQDVETDANELVNGTAGTATSSPVPITEENVLTATDILDAVQMLAVANKKSLLAPSHDTVAQLTKQAGQNAKINLTQSFKNEDLHRRLVARSKKLIVDCQKSDDYKDAALWFIERFETLFRTLQDQIGKLDASKIESALSHNAEPLLQFVQNFVGDAQDVRELLQVAHQVSLGATQDATIKAFWHDADQHVRKTLLQEGYILTDEARKQWHALVERFKQMEASYKSKVNTLVQGILKVVDAIRHDKLLLEVFKVILDIVHGLRGEGWKARSLWDDLRHKILPPLLKKFGVIPLPRIKYTHPEFSLVIENISLQLSTLLPDTFDFGMQNNVHVDFRNLKSSDHAHRFKIKFKGMSLRVYDVAFAFTSHFGFTFHDQGIADLNIKGLGVSVYIDIPKSEKLGAHYFLVRKVNAKLGKLSLKVHKSNHPVLHFLADKLANSYLTKRVLRHFIGVGITLGLKQLDVQLMQMRLGRDGRKGDIQLEDVKRQTAELRDLLRKYHEQAGTIEIDFTRDDGDNATPGGKTLSEKAKAAGKSFEESHAVRWVKRQVDETGRKEIVRDEWRSNAFDMDGMDTIAKKPQGQTTDETIVKAQEHLDESEQSAAAVREEQEIAQKAPADAMESRAGKEIVQQTDNHDEQIERLEERVDEHIVANKHET